MHGVQRSSEGEHHGVFSFTGNKEGLCVEGETQKVTGGGGTNLDATHRLECLCSSEQTCTNDSESAGPRCRITALGVNIDRDIEMSTCFSRRKKKNPPCETEHVL